jgi:hypothetical protein
MNLFARNRCARVVVWAVILSTLAFLVTDRQQHNGYFNWRTNLWADQAGYYIYSPALFIYGFDASRLPENIAERTGDGFSVNEEGKIITRYTSGVAIMQAPVFLCVHLAARLIGQKQDGFSGIYHWVPSIAAILYSFLGIMLLWHYLKFYFNRKIAFFSILTIYTGTNLLYYAIDATGMSHIYSFFLFSLLLLASKLFFTENQPQKQTIYFLLVSLTSAFIILVRPTNLAFIGLVFLLDISSWKEFLMRLQKVLQIKYILILVCSAFIVFLPQMLYWNYSSGSYFTDSYEGYGFTNWASPQIIPFLFSPNNGLFPYNPVYVLIFASLFYMIWKKNLNGYYILFVFLGLVYVFSSWFIYSFGCGFGSRNFVEYTAVFALPLGILYHDISKRSQWIIILPVIFIMINLKLIYSFDKCFNSGDWDWNEYVYLLKHTKYQEEYQYLSPLVLGSGQEYTPAKRIKVDKVAKVNFRRAVITTSFRTFKQDTEAVVVLQIETGDSIMYWNGIKLVDDTNSQEPGTKIRTKADFGLPRHYSTDAVVSTFIWNIKKDSLHISKMEIYLE